MPKYKSAFITTNKRLEDQQIRLEHMDSTASKKISVFISFKLIHELSI